ncbi:MAG: hypothetical protein ACI91B_002387 [Planctomycetota bacterium]
MVVPLVEMAQTRTRAGYWGFVTHTQNVAKSDVSIEVVPVTGGKFWRAGELRKPITMIR